MSETSSINVRMPKEMYDQIGRIAAQEERSLNWIIVRLLKEALAARQS